MITPRWINPSDVHWRETRAVTVVEPSQVGEARRAALALSHALGLSEETASRAATIASEAASNLVKHTGGKGGEILVQAARYASAPGVDVIAIDRGPGMTNVGLCFNDGFSTAGTQGIGLGGIRRMSAQFDVHTDPGLGTAILARVLEPQAAGAASAPGLFEVGGVCVAVAGETVSGDAWCLRRDADSETLMVVDGLGHGPLAHEAAAAAVDLLIDRDPEPTVQSQLMTLHRGLHRTRGAAVALARVAREGGPIRYSGVGNVAGSIIRSATERASALVSLNGIVGHECQRAQQFEYPMAAGDLLVMHTDGLLSRWTLDRYAGARNRHPVLLAAMLYRDFRRSRDDSTVVVARRRVPGAA